MNILMVMLSGVALVNNQNINKNEFEAITGTKVVEQYKIIPKELIQLKMAENQLVAKKKKTKNAQKKKKIVQKKKKIIKKSTKKVQKKKVVKKKKKTYKTYRIAYNKSEVQAYAHDLVLSYGWSEYDFECLVKLWNRESSWNLNAVNKRSGACGIPQSLPCSKMKSAGADYRTNYKTQIRWGLNYIKARYGSPANAWGHSQRKGWY